MRIPFVCIILMICLCAISTGAACQVRVKRAHKHRFEKKRDKKLPKEKTVRQKKPQPVSEISIIPSDAKKQSDTHDSRYYIKWSAEHPLKYYDFLYNRNLYNKFVTVRDTDLTRVIYPDYRDFYRILAQRRQTEQIIEDSLWRNKVEAIIRERMSRNIYEELEESIDSAHITNISIDSPAASVILLQPITYPIGKNKYYYNISALFSKTDSWMIIKSKDILEHEQIHFDIFELHARKMRKHLVETIKHNISKGTYESISDDLAPGFEKLYNELNEMQLEFDRQTGAITANNAPITAINAQWKNKLRNAISLLSKYASAEGTIILN